MECFLTHILTSLNRQNNDIPLELEPFAPAEHLQFLHTNTYDAS